MAKNDPGSNYAFTNVLQDVDADAGTIYTTGIDHSTGESATYLIDVLAVATTLLATLQHSSDNGIADAWTDEADTKAGNTVSVAKDAALGMVQLDVPQPRERYTRLKIVTTGDNAIISVNVCQGPTLLNEPAATVVG